MVARDRRPAATVAEPRPVTSVPSVALGAVSWRLPCALLDAPALAADVGARRLQVDYGGHGRPHELIAGGRLAGQLRRAADDSGVKVTVVAVNALNDVGVPVRGASARRERDALVRGALDAAAELGAATVLVPAFRRSVVRDGADLERTTEFLAETARAAPAGVGVAHENVLPAWALTAMLASLDGCGVSVVFDVGNLHEHKVDWREYLHAASPFLHPEVHLKDFQRPPAGGVPLGAGSVPLPEVVGAVRRTGRVSCLVVETDHRRSTRDQLRADTDTVAHLLADNETGAPA